jgi:hypothetical protein
MCISICSSQCRDAGRAQEIKNLGQQWMPLTEEIFPLVILGTRAISSSVLLQVRHVGDMQRKSETRQYRINVTFIQKHESYWYSPVSTAHFQGFCWTKCLVWFINGDGEKREDRLKSWSCVTYANILIYDTRTVSNTLCRELSHLSQ